MRRVSFAEAAVSPLQFESGVFYYQEKRVVSQFQNWLRTHKLYWEQLRMDSVKRINKRTVRGEKIFKCNLITEFEVEMKEKNK